MVDAGWRMSNFPFSLLLTGDQVILSGHIICPSLFACSMFIICAILTLLSAFFESYVRSVHALCDLAIGISDSRLRERAFV